MNFKKTLLAVSLTTFAATAVAVPVLDNGGDGNGTGLQSQLNLITVAPSPVPGTSSVNVNNDQIADDVDSYWGITGSGGSVSTFVMEIAGQSGSNTFGIYERGNAANYVELFSGSDTFNDGLNSQISLSILADGTVGISGIDTGKDFTTFQFGFYLGTANGPTFYSDSSLNQNESDQMVALQGKDIDTIQIQGYPAGMWTKNEFILAWEDILYANSDKDFNDLIVIVESVLPVSVPEPGTLALLGLGLAGLGAARRRQKS
jgi:hypothetical protein